MKSPWWIGVGLAALFAFGTSTVLADKECDKKKKDGEQSELLADCGKCDKDKGDDEEEEESEEALLLADSDKEGECCDKDKGDCCDKDKDGEESAEELLADCGKCDKDKGDDHEDGDDHEHEDDELLADCGKCDKDKGDDDDDHEEEDELLVA
jgi:hypothetical protein